jgi:hypothetical protein
VRGCRGSGISRRFFRHWRAVPGLLIRGENLLLRDDADYPKE